MVYLLIPQGVPELHIDVDVFKNELCSQWQRVEFESLTLPHDLFALSWSVADGACMHYGDLHNDRRTIGLVDEPKCVAQFAIWYRSIIPKQYLLFVYHDSSEHEVEVTSTSTEDEIVDALNAF